MLENLRKETKANTVFSERNDVGYLRTSRWDHLALALLIFGDIVQEDGTPMLLLSAVSIARSWLSDMDSQYAFQNGHLSNFAMLTC